MPYTTEDGGRLNNSHVSRRCTKQSLPPRLNSENILWGIAAATLISGLLFVTSLRVELKLIINAFSQLAKIYFGFVA